MSMFSSSCPSKEHLSAFGAGRLDDEAMPRIANHLHHCVICQQSLESLLTQSLLLAASVHVPAEVYASETMCGRAVQRAAALAGDSTISGWQSVPAESRRETRQGRLGDYELLKEIARGGMGVVYEVRQLHLNRLVDATGQPRVTGFGLAKEIGASSGMTQSGQVMGTPSYMPPEQAEGELERLGPRTDVYSLGATLYYLLTSRPPFQAANSLETLKQVVERDPVAPRALNPAVNRDLDTICLKCLEKKPERHYASAQALADDLGGFLDGVPIKARRVGEFERLLRWSRRNPLVAGSLAGVAAIFLSAFAIVTVQRIQSGRSPARLLGKGRHGAPLRHW